MKIQNNYTRGGYSTQTAEKYIEYKKPLYSLSTDLEELVRFIDKKPTDEVIGYKAWFSQEGLPPFSIKFSKQINLPKYLEIVEIENLTACEVKYNVFFKADGLKVVE
ncbi:hypothetical protein ACRCJS_05360 [Aerococcus urinaeequi]|uniref:hypothetical protein n=1 Tax=Aerococcus urinaeequi TaxID=51665 RepID=UPI003D6A89F3